MAGPPLELVPEARDDAAFRLVRRAAEELGIEAWAVGGYVRDLLLGRTHPDLDVVTVAGRGMDLAGRFAALAGGPPPVLFPRFGTAQVTWSGRLVEFVSARAESYPAGSRKPSVWPAALAADLRRRDFTVNTMLVDLDGRLHDPLDGRADLERRILRTPADPLVTFADDPLRMLRAARFAAQLDFELDPAILPAMRARRERARPPVVSVERIRGELERMLVTPRPSTALGVLDEGGLVETLLPELWACHGVAQGGWHTRDVYGHTLLAVDESPVDLDVRVAALFHDVGKPATAAADGSFIGHDRVGAVLARSALERLRFSHAQIERTARLVELHLRPVFYDRDSWSDAAVRRLARDAAGVLPQLLALARADIAASAYPDGAKLDHLEERLRGVLAERPSRLELPVTGADIMTARGLQPGPEVGRLKARLLELIVDGELAPERAAVLEALRRSDL